MKAEDIKPGMLITGVGLIIETDASVETDNGELIKEIGVTFIDIHKQYGVARQGTIAYDEPVEIFWERGSEEYTRIVQDCLDTVDMLMSDVQDWLCTMSDFLVEDEKAQDERERADLNTIVDKGTVHEIKPKEKQ